MKFKSAWVLLIILVAIAAYFFLVEERRRAARKKADMFSRELVPYGADEVEKIVLINPDGDRIEMERRADGWMITSPVVTKGAGSTIDILLKQLVPGLKLEEFGDVESTAEFGLDDPFASAILYSRGRPHPDTIHIGDKTPTSSKCYVRLGSSRNVVITREMTHNVMNKNLYHLRDKNFVDFSSGSIDSMIITNGDLRIPLARRDMTWWMTERGVRADRVKIEQYLIKLTSAIVREFVSEDAEELESFGLEKPEKNITIYRGTEAMEISFGAERNGMVHVLRSDPRNVLLLEDDLLSIFVPEEKDLMSHNLAFFDAELIKGLRYDSSDTSVVLRKRDGEWSVQGNDTLKISPYAISDFFRTLKEIRYDEFLDEAAPASDDGFAPFALRLELEDGEGSVIELITISTPFSDYEIGSSRSSGISGKLKKYTLSKIRRHFKRLGAI